MDVLFGAGVIGTAVFAVDGFYAGARKNLDLMGVFIVSALTASGGGAVRDVLLGQIPAVLTDPFAFWPAPFAMLAAYMLKLHRRPEFGGGAWFAACDAAGLVAFSAAGALKAMNAGLSLFGTVAVAFVTAVGGGVIRDMLVNDVPAVLRADFYGSISVLLAAFIYLTRGGGAAAHNAVLLSALAAAFFLRMAAWKFKWRLPKISLQ